MVEALPVGPGMRVLAIGCGPGAAARWLAGHRPGCHAVAIDRSPKAVGQALAASGEPLATGRLEFRRVAIEDFALAPREARFDLAFAVRVGALDGRHPDVGLLPLERLAVLAPQGRVSIDGGAPLPIRALRWLLLRTRG